MARLNPATEFAYLFRHQVEVTGMAMAMRKPDAAERLARLRELAESRRHIEGHVVTDDRLAAISALLATWGDPARLVREPTDLVAEATAIVKGKPVRVVLARNTDLGPTPEAAAKPGRISPVVTLYRAGLIDEDGVRAAREIAWVVEEVGRSSRARAQMLQAAGGASPFWRQYMADDVAAVWSGRYVPWAREQRAVAERSGSRNLDACLAAIVFGESLTGLAARLRRGRERVYGFVADGIEDYVFRMQRPSETEQG